MRTDKVECFEYLVHLLIKRRPDKYQDFTTLKLIKLLFFTVGISSTEKEDGLTGIFNNFVAMPYGPVESDIYTNIQKGSSRRYRITPNSLNVINDKIPFEVEEELESKIEEALDKLLTKNPNILECQAFQLVDISHKWSCWRICYHIAIENGKRSIGIPSEMIKDSIKYYQ